VLLQIMRLEAVRKIKPPSLNGDAYCSGFKFKSNHKYKLLVTQSGFREFFTIFLTALLLDLKNNQRKSILLLQDLRSL